MMIIKGSLILFLFLHYSGLAAQDLNHVKKRCIKGYFIWELKLDERNDYLLKAAYFKNWKGKYSTLNQLFPGIDLCERVDSSFYQFANQKAENPLNSNYEFYRDTVMDVPVPDVIIKGTFYKDANGTLYMITKICSKAIIIDSMCSEFENSNALSTICGAALKNKGKLVSQLSKIIDLKRGGFNQDPSMVNLRKPIKDFSYMITRLCTEKGSKNL